jgi:hypothetical protein
MNHLQYNLSNNKILGVNKMKRIIFLVIIIIALCSCGARYESKIVSAKIIEKDYDKAKTKKVKHTKKSGKTTKTYYTTQYVPAEYEITVVYDKIEKEIEITEDEYNKLEVGDSYKVNLVTGYDKESNKIVSKYLE